MKFIESGNMWNLRYEGSEPPYPLLVPTVRRHEMTSNSVIQLCATAPAPAPIIPNYAK